MIIEKRGFIKVLFILKNFIMLKSKFQRILNLKKIKQI